MTIKELYSIFSASEGVCTDTRNITKGGIFFALKGASFNGNLFAEKALEQGALKVVVDEKEVVLNDDYIYVDDVLTCLQKLANYHRRQLNIPVVGITGTNGKTTTKELIKVVLDRKYNAYATLGNFNNHIGVPLTLLSLDKHVEIAVIEMGANHQGEIDFLCQIAEPNFGLITNVGKAHLEGFGSFDGVKKTKGELYRFIEERKGLLFVNKTNNHLLGMLNKGAELYYYGNSEDCSVSVMDVNNSANLSFSCNVGSDRIKLDTQLIGGYNLENALAAISVGNYFGVDASNIAYAINEYAPENNRSQMVKTANNRVLFDAYNANPTSMKAALENFVDVNEKNKVVVLGEMKELGDDSRLEHNVTLNYLRENDFSAVYLVGENYQHLLNENDDFNWFKDVEALKDYFIKNQISDAFILVKGSRTNQLEKLKNVL